MNWVKIRNWNFALPFALYLLVCVIIQVLDKFIKLLRKRSILCCFDVDKINLVDRITCNFTPIPTKQYWAVLCHWNAVWLKKPNLSNLVTPILLRCVIVNKACWVVLSWASLEMGCVELRFCIHWSHVLSIGTPPRGGRCDTASPKLLNRLSKFEQYSAPIGMHSVQVYRCA